MGQTTKLQEVIRKYQVLQIDAELQTTRLLSRALLEKDDPKPYENTESRNPKW